MSLQRFNDFAGAFLAGVDLADWAIGAVLVAGFLAMLLLDHVQQAMVGGSHAHVHTHVHNSSSSQSVHRQHSHCSDEDPEDDRTCVQKVALSGRIPT